jgi:ribosomal protein S18 acetylase RimI-like enzyme
VTDTTTPFQIRLIRPEEYESLGDLTVAAYGATGNDMPHQDEYNVVLRDVERRARTSCVAVAIVSDCRVLGGVTYVCGPQDPYSEELLPGEAGIRMLAVDPAVQGRGVGRALTEWCLARARSEGRARLVLHTSHAMPVAVLMYERLGFARVPENDFTPVPGVNLIAYAFDLSAS